MLDLNRLLDQPAAALKSAAGDELVLLTLQHEHADKVTIERKHLGQTIDIGNLLQLIGSHGIADLPQLLIQVTEITAPQLPAPIEPVAAPSAPAASHVCPQCSMAFQTPQGLGSHIHARHKPTPAPDSPEREPKAPQVRVVQREGICLVCQSGVAFHERCSDCQALLGPAHEAGSIAGDEDGKPLCAMCLDYRRVEHELDIGASVEVSHA